MTDPRWLEPSPPLPVDELGPEVSADGSPSGDAPRLSLVLGEFGDEEIWTTSSVDDLERRNLDGGLG